MRLARAVFFCGPLCIAACTQTQPSGSSTGPEGFTSSSGPSASSAAGATSSGTSAGSSGTSGGGPSATGGSSSGNNSTGTTTGNPPPSFIDGGYVSCSFTSDAGPDGDGGTIYWDCAPGTYFCDPRFGTAGCSQCRTDADCTDKSLPTYDPRKPHCDTTTPAFGYRNFCEECLSNADCAGNPNGNFCNLNGSLQQPSIETIGFETCDKLNNDCRLDGGPICNGIDEYCDPQSGACLLRSGACQSDNDCAGYLSPTNPSVLEPFCGDAGVCSSCPGGFCPNGFCLSDAACSNGQVCDMEFTDECSCTDDSQCTGLAPACVDLDGSRVNDAGQVLGFCGCTTDDQCGDGGGVCLAAQSGEIPSCGVGCTSPDFPSCYAAAGYPVCDPQDETCVPCLVDNQCRDSKDPRGPRCDAQLGGFGSCGCSVDQDCPAGEVCAGFGNPLSTCTQALSRCTPDSCPQGFCDWKSGLCGANLSTGGPRCIDDYDCGAAAGASVNYPRCTAGVCGCQSNADCVASGAAANGFAHCCLLGEACIHAGNQSNTCVSECDADADCVGNPGRSGCIIQDGGLFPNFCGCGSDADCTGQENGQHCVRDPASSFNGFCDCVSNADCGSGFTCRQFGGGIGVCNAFCASVDGGECAPGYFCDPAGACRPRCDGTNQCQGTDAVCDTQNIGGQNGQIIGFDAPGVTWCYACALPSDCPAGEGCVPGMGCGDCLADANCPTGTVCLDGGACQPACEDGGCPNGQVCDVHGLAGGGPNVCYECLSPADCPNLEGCNSQTHTCGTCSGPNAFEYLTSDCPPDAICSSYWSQLGDFPAVCLANCDRNSCPANEPICAVYPAITPDHKYCFGCLKDSDCGPNQRCNNSLQPTFTCVSAD